jgi:hypothetical protein
MQILTEAGVDYTLMPIGSITTEHVAVLEEIVLAYRSVHGYGRNRGVSLCQLRAHFDEIEAATRGI